MINHESIKINLIKLSMNISINMIQSEEHIIKSENIFTSGFVMDDTYLSINRGN